MANSPIISLSKLAFRYEDQEAFTIQGIDLCVARGECVLITGESGSGKTTISKCINGLIPNFHPGELDGELTVDGTLGETIRSIYDASIT